MRPLIEKILAMPDESFTATRLRGKAIDCEYHVHQEYELVSINSSYGSRLINDNIGQFEAGSLFLVAPLVPHLFDNRMGEGQDELWSDFSVIQFRESFAGIEIFRLPEFKRIREMLANSSFGLEFNTKDNKNILNLMQKVVTITNNAQRLVFFLELLEELSRTPYTMVSTVKITENRTEDDMRLNRAIKYIHSELAKGATPSLKIASSHANLGVESFSRYFLRATGRKFIDYVINIKLGQAANLLIHSKLQISEICFQVGYNNLSNFNRQFKKVHGVTPRDFRKKFIISLKKYT